MRSVFDAMADHALGRLQPSEALLLWWAEERTDFCRFNHGRVRQAGAVVQRNLTLRLIVGQRHASATLTCGAGDSTDRDRIDATLATLRAQVAALPDDPHLLWEQEGVVRVENADGGEPIAADQLVRQICDLASDVDLVGILASGPVARGFASSTGARGWHVRQSWHLDYSLHLRADKAVKASVAAQRFGEADQQALRASIAAARERLQLLHLPEVQVPRGAYRAWLEPAAVAEILGLMSWGGFSADAQQTRQSPLLKLANGERTLDPRIQLHEDTAGGLAPRFTAEGFLRPDRVALVQDGRHAGALVAPRTAAEYGLDGNGAGGDESPESLAMAPGVLDPARSAELVGDGVWVGNLWYLNWSDRIAARMTGMTRFASFAVRDGEIVGPLSVMRFDDSIYRVFGEGLVGLGNDAPLMPDAGTYGARGSACVRAPGALIDGFSFTL